MSQAVLMFAVIAGSVFALMGLVLLALSFGTGRRVPSPPVPPILIKGRLM